MQIPGRQTVFPQVKKTEIRPGSPEFSAGTGFSTNYFNLKETQTIPFDYKKEYKEFYLPPGKPTLVTIPPMNYFIDFSAGRF